jgi:hypothetical protein
VLGAVCTAHLVPSSTTAAGILYRVGTGAASHSGLLSLIVLSSVPDFHTEFRMSPAQRTRCPTMQSNSGEQSAPCTAQHQFNYGSVLPRQAQLGPRAPCLGLRPSRCPGSQSLAPTTTFTGSARVRPVRGPRQSLAGLGVEHHIMATDTQCKRAYHNTTPVLLPIVSPPHPEVHKWIVKPSSAPHYSVLQL